MKVEKLLKNRTTNNEFSLPIWHLSDLIQAQLLLASEFSIEKLGITPALQVAGWMKVPRFVKCLYPVGVFPRFPRCARPGYPQVAGFFLYDV